MIVPDQIDRTYSGYTGGEGQYRKFPTSGAPFPENEDRRESKDTGKLPVRTAAQAPASIQSRGQY